MLKIYLRWNVAKTVVDNGVWWIESLQMKCQQTNSLVLLDNKGKIQRILQQNRNTTDCN